MPTKKYISNREALHTGDGVKGLGDPLQLSDEHAAPLLALGAILVAEEQAVVASAEGEDSARAAEEAAKKAAAEDADKQAAAEEAAKKAAAEEAAKKAANKANSKKTGK